MNRSCFCCLKTNGIRNCNNLASFPGIRHPFREQMHRSLEIVHRARFDHIYLTGGQHPSCDTLQRKRIPDMRHRCILLQCRSETRRSQCSRAEHYFGGSASTFVVMRGDRALSFPEVILMHGLFSNIRNPPAGLFFGRPPANTQDIQCGMKCALSIVAAEFLLDTRSSTAASI